MARLRDITNVPDTRTGSKLWSCKTREQVSLFISLKATALSFIYWEILRISVEQIQNGLLCPMGEKILRQNQLTKIPVRF